jgi:hypothetical protein
MRKQNPDTKAMRKERDSLRTKRFIERIQSEVSYELMMQQGKPRPDPFVFIYPEKNQSIFSKIKSFFGGVK